MLSSKSFELNKDDLVVLGKNTLLVGFAAMLTYIVQNLSNINLGTSSILLVPVVTMVIDTIIKWANNNVTPNDEVKS